MARRRADGSDHRGGEGIQAPRSRRPRVATGLAAFGAAAALASYPALQDLHLRWLAIALGGLALAFLAAGLATRSAGALGWGLAALGGEYAVLFAAQGRALDEAAPVYAVGFLLVAELAFWSVERRIAAWSDPALAERRIGLLVGVCAGAAAVAALVLVVAAASVGAGIALEASGVAAAIGALVLLGVLVRRTAASQGETSLR